MGFYCTLGMLSPNFKSRLWSPQGLRKFNKEKFRKDFNFENRSQDVGEDDHSPIDYSLNISEAIIFNSENSDTVCE